VEPLPPRGHAAFNDGVPGEKSIRWPGLHALQLTHPAVCRQLLYRTGRGRVVPHDKGRVHAPRLPLVCLPVRRAAVPRNVWSVRGKMDKCTFLRRRPRGQWQPGRV
jgi:hypothetical protein